MSKRYFFASSRIEERFGSLDRLLKVWVLDRGRNYQINGSPEERFQGFEKAEVGIGIAASRQRFKLNKEIQIAFAWTILSYSGGAEQFQAPDAKAAAQGFKFSAMLSDKRGHGRSLHNIAPDKRKRNARGGGSKEGRNGWRRSLKGSICGLGKRGRLFSHTAGVGSHCLRLLLAAIELANRIGANLPHRVLDGRGLLALPVFALVAAADERAFDQDVIALAKRCRNALAETIPRDHAMPFRF